MRERRRLENEYIGALLHLQRVAAEDEIPTPALIPGAAIEQSGHARIGKIAAKGRYGIGRVIEEGRRFGRVRRFGAEMPVGRQVVINIPCPRRRPLRTRSPTSAVLHSAFD